MRTSAGMPVMDGFEATGRIRASVPTRVPIIALAANAQAGDRQRCLDAGLDDYSSKPVNVNALRALLDTWLRRAA